MKKPTYNQLEGQVQFYQEVIEEARKEIMKSLRQAGLWNPEFHQKELMASAMVISALKENMDKKTEAVAVAVGFIGKFENDQIVGHDAFKALDSINFLLTGENLSNRG